mmetsp:Transcript_25176/g.54394  ORF Transcript_25176/g.54394 Transcript_25176/m.54394 type:complete len:203 (-) Transcript_25176:701-1309(-)
MKACTAAARSKPPPNPKQSHSRSTLKTELHQLCDLRLVFRAQIHRWWRGRRRARRGSGGHCRQQASAQTSLTQNVQQSRPFTPLLDLDLFAGHLECFADLLLEVRRHMCDQLRVIKLEEQFARRQPELQHAGKYRVVCARCGVARLLQHRAQTPRHLLLHRRIRRPGRLIAQQRENLLGSQGHWLCKRVGRYSEMVRPRAAR